MSYWKDLKYTFVNWWFGRDSSLKRPEPVRVTLEELKEEQLARKQAGNVPSSSTPPQEEPPPKKRVIRTLLEKKDVVKEVFHDLIAILEGHSTEDIDEYGNVTHKSIPCTGHEYAVEKQKVEDLIPIVLKAVNETARARIRITDIPEEYLYFRSTEGQVDLDFIFEDQKEEFVSFLKYICYRFPHSISNAIREQYPMHGFTEEQFAEKMLEEFDKAPIKITKQDWHHIPEEICYRQTFINTFNPLTSPSERGYGRFEWAFNNAYSQVRQKRDYDLLWMKTEYYNAVMGRKEQHLANRPFKRRQSLRPKRSRLGRP